MENMDLLEINKLSPFMLFWLGLNVAAKAAGAAEWTFGEARDTWERVKEHPGVLVDSAAKKFNEEEA